MGFNLEGKVALIGGASQGIGRATAEVFAELGARVVLMSRRTDVLEQVRVSLPNASHHRTLSLDLESTDEVISTVQRLIADMGPITIWVNNTGGPKSGLLKDASLDELERGFRGHVVASQAILRALLPGMKSAGHGRIINVLSTSVKVPLANLGVSNVIRAAMANWAKTLANELGEFGVTVNNVLPGYTETPRLEALLGGNEDKKRQWAESVPLKRLASPKETARAIAFLASDWSSYISGVNLPVDGGRTPSL